MSNDGKDSAGDDFGVAKRLKRRYLVPLAAAAAVMAVAGGVAYATIPDSGGVIHGCYDSGGNLKVIDTSVEQACPKGYSALNWNQTGLQGPQGPQGAQGQTGPGGTINGVTAGGDLTGTYPSPSIAAGAITPDKIGAIPAARIDAPGVDNGSGGCCSDQVIPNFSEVPVQFPTARFDTDGMHTDGVDLATNTRLTVPVSGIYQIDGGVIWYGAAQNQSTAGFRQVEIWVNGNSVIAGTNRLANTDENNNLESVSGLWKLNVGDYVELRVNQESGAPMPLPQDPRTHLDMVWVAPG